MRGLQKYRSGVYVCIVIICIFALWYVTQDHLSSDDIITYIENNRVKGAFLFASIMFLATVIAPITVLPLVPLVSPLLGPLTTALASCIGWTLGAIVAFCIARKFGQPCW